MITKQWLKNQASISQQIAMKAEWLHIISSDLLGDTENLVIQCRSDGTGRTRLKQKSKIHWLTLGDLNKKSRNSLLRLVGENENPIKYKHIHKEDILKWINLDSSVVINYN